MAKGMEVALHCHHPLWLSSLFQNAFGQTLALGRAGAHAQRRVAVFQDPGGWLGQNALDRASIFKPKQGLFCRLQE